MSYAHCYTLGKERSEHKVNPFEEILDWVKNAIHSLFPFVEESVIGKLMLETPPPYIMADYALSVFPLKSTSRYDPCLIAKDIIKHCSKKVPPTVVHISAKGPYINITLNKKLYYKRVIAYIKSQGDLFGSYRDENPLSVDINYLNPTFRTSFIGKVIGKHYEWGGNTVHHRHIFADDVSLISMGREVVLDALQRGLAEYITDTRAVVTRHIPPLILQRHDTTVTKHALYLAHQKNLGVKKRSSLVLYIARLEERAIIETFINNSRLFNYLPSEINPLVLFVNKVYIDTESSNEDRTLQYALLRIPIDYTTPYTKEDKRAYNYLEDALDQLQNINKKCNKGFDLSNFDVVKLLISFPLIVKNVLYSHKPSILCAYLEKVSALCKKRSVWNDIDLSQVATIVLQNGLRLLTF